MSDRSLAWRHGWNVFPHARNRGETNSGTLGLADAEGPKHLRELQRTQGFETKWLHLWASSPERTWYMERRYVPLRRALAGVLILLVAWRLEFSLGPSLEVFSIVAGLLVLGAGFLVWATLPYLAARGAFIERKKALAEYRVNIALKRVCASTRDGNRLPLEGFFELNRRQLDEYQEMTKHQQRLAFRLTWMASTTGFLALIAGVILSLRVGPGTEQYVVAGLAGLGTLLSGFLGKTFYNGHRDAMDQLNYYYSEPSMTGRILAAERIASGNMGEGERAKYAQALMDTVLTWKPPHAPYRRGSRRDSVKSANGRPKTG